MRNQQPHLPSIRERRAELVGDPRYYGDVGETGLVDRAESTRVAALADIDAATQSERGQFFTPGVAAELIASMLNLPDNGTVRILDPGAGSGILSAALVARILRENPDLHVDLVAIERDPVLIPHLQKTLLDCERASAGRVKTQAVEADFILDSIGIRPRLDLDSSFDLVIENPPYGKLTVSSPHRKAMRASGLDAPNLYAAFLSLSIATLKEGGQLAAITPRSFFNGPYFGSFRSYFLDSLTLNHIHVFDSRTTVFADTGVLQENVVFAGTRGMCRGSSHRSVVVSVSHDHTDQPTAHTIPLDSVVRPDDPHKFIRLAAGDEDTAVAEFVMAQPLTLADLGIRVSTGRVVAFRSREALHDTKLPGAHPLVYPGNLRLGEMQWPREIRKPQWFVPATESDRALLMPGGWYTVAKRFSSKEEKRRIVTATWSPHEHAGPVAFENHLNVFHAGGKGLDENIAKGLSVWLNSSAIDRFFRTFSGHTQVNATDLRTLRFPHASTLRILGQSGAESQQEIDDVVLEKVGER